MRAGLPRTFSLIYFSSGRVTTWQPYTFLHIKRGREQLTKTTLLSLRISTSFLSFTCCTQRHKEHVKMLWTQHFKFATELSFVLVGSRNFCNIAVADITCFARIYWKKPIMIWQTELSIPCYSLAVTTYYQSLYIKNTYNNTRMEEQNYLKMGIIFHLLFSNNYIQKCSIQS
jgi:hypothetical protein